MAMIKNFDKATKTLTVEFTNLTSVIEYIKEAQTNECFATSRYLSSQSYGSDFHGTNSFEEAMKYLEFGWTAKSEVLSKKLQMAKKVTPQVSRRKVFQSVAGYTPIVPNYLMGVPTDMLNTKLTKIDQKVITLNKDISYNSMYTVEQIEDSSVKAFQIVQAIEAQGIRCNLNIIQVTDLYSAKNVKKLVVKMRVKSSSELMNVSKTSFPLVNTGMKRRIYFRMLETLPEFKQEDRGICFGYGRSAESREVQRIVESQKQYYLNRDIYDVEKVADDLVNLKK